MSRKILCPSCGTTAKVGFNPIPPRCTGCGTRLPFTTPRTLAYVARTVWKPVFAFIAGFLLFWGVPQLQAYRATLAANQVTAP